MVFLLPLVHTVVTALTAGQVLIGGTVVAGSIAAGKALHDRGRAKGQKEGAEAILQELERRGILPSED